MKILLCGIQKSGNTWCRFVIFNYFNILNNHATRTLTWDELQKPHLLRVEKGVNYEYTDGFPLIFFSHNAYDGQGINVKYEEYLEYFEQFDKIIYIIRNVFDTCISYWHFIQNRVEVDYEKDLEEFTEYFLPKWIHHVKTTKDKADLVLNYDVLRTNSIGFWKAIQLIDDNVNFVVLEKAIKMSSFNNIRKMSIEIGQVYGLGGPTYKGFFCRDGRSGQYKEVMDTKLIEDIRWKCKEEGISV